MDIWNRITKFFDHERYTMLGAAVLISLVGFVGCGSYDGKVVSATSGETVGANELEREYILESNAIAGSIEEQQLIIAAADARIQASLQRAETLNANVEADASRIAEENAKRDLLIDRTVGVAKLVIPGSSEYLNLILGAFGIGSAALAGGTALDNRRKNLVIKAKAEPSTGGTA